MSAILYTNRIHVLSCLRMALKLSDRNFQVNVAAALENRKFWKPMEKVEITAIRNNLNHYQ